MRTGARGEELAARFLEGKGYTILERNYRFAHEEIDLVCFLPNPENEGGEIVFVEVKTRKGDSHGRPEESVDRAKQQAIMRVAEAYLFERRLGATLVRFDVVSVRLATDPPALDHFENAFGYFV
jgi:putative endonuclease